MADPLEGPSEAQGEAHELDLAFLDLPDVDEGDIQLGNGGLIFPDVEAAEPAPQADPLGNAGTDDKGAVGDPWAPSGDPEPSTRPANAAPVVLTSQNATHLLAPGIIPPSQPLEPRPVRQSRLKRTFDVAELEGDDDLGDEEEAQRRPKQRPVLGSQQAQQRSMSGDVKKRTQSDLASATLLRGESGGGNGGSGALPVVAPAALVPVDFPCPVDSPFPRKQRSARAVRPRSSRAAIARLKQAAHGTLPLGGSRSGALALLVGGGAGDADIESDPEDAAYDSDDSRYKRRGGGGGDGGGGAAPPGARQQHHHQQQQRQQRPAYPGMTPGGPTEDQRRRMAEIAAAPPHLRQLMLQQLMRERLGEATAGPAGGSASAPQLASLSREEQQAVVQRLMSEMTPQQRHTLLNMPTHQQAVVLQQYYTQNFAPKQMPAATAPPPAQPWGGPQAGPMLGQMGPLAGPTAGPTLPGGLGLGNPELARQLSGLPREQQQAIVLHLLKQHHMQQQQQLRAQQLAVPQQPPQQPPQQQQQQQFMQFPAATAGLPAAGGLLGQAAPAGAAMAQAPPGNAMVQPPSLVNLLGAGLGTSFAASNDPLMSEAGLVSLLNPGGGGQDADALQDAMKFFLEGA